MALDSSWTFHLGFFSGSFVPAETNTASWCANWITVDVASYNETQKRFLGVWDDDGSVSPGTKGYIWGVNRGGSNPEWILMSADDWLWPLMSSNPLDPNGDTEWLVDDADEVILGQVNMAGVHMKTAATTGSPPVLAGEQWTLLQFTESERDDELVSGWEADPDDDGWSNLAEFAFGLNPKSADRPSLLGNVGTGFFEFTIEKAEKVAVDYFGQVSDDLIVWKEDAASVSLVGETATTLTYRDLTPLATSTRFGRVQISLQP